MDPIRTTIGAVVLSGVATSTGLAQSRQVPAPPQNHPVVIHSATVHTVSGDTIEGGYVVFKKGVIESVGTGAPPPVTGAIDVDASDLHVFPGLIAADTLLGLQETGAVDVTHDHTEYGRVTPEVRPVVAVNPDSDLIPVARANGILTAMLMPQGGLVSGQTSLVRLDGWTWENLAIDAEAGLVINWPRTEPIRSRWMNRSASEQQKEIKESLKELDRIFDEADAYAAAREHDPAVAVDLRFEAMRPAMEGTKPVFIRASSAGQIEGAVAWAGRRGLRCVIVGGSGADRVLPLLKKHDVPVIVRGLHRLPSARHEDYDRPFALPAKLHEAGVRFCIASGAGPAHERNLNHNAATAAAYGLPREMALQAVTLAAADILGAGDQLGSLESGKAATLIITTGNPLEITTDTLIAYIDGRRIDLGNRQKTLYAKYSEKYRQLGLLE